MNNFKFDSNTCCSLVKYTVGKLISGVISLSMSIPNVFLKNAILCPIGVFAFSILLLYYIILYIFS